ncbi:hypothetical protein KC336_g11664 [Hortaea werneckii]|nr:hypothetical protein KC336_g11664 [Hortaea werneckii]
MHSESDVKDPKMSESKSFPDVGVIPDVDVGRQEDLKRPLLPRHVQMIAIGGVIGTGLFLGTADNLKNGGPAGLLLSYCIMASLLYSVMVALGEMITQFPLPGGQFTLASRFVSPELGFAMGWLYWYNYIIVLPAEISAAAVLVSYWTPASDPGSTCTMGVCNNAMWVGLMLIVVLAINFAGTRAFGEMEFWFCSIKVITVIGLIITGVIITAGGGPNGEAIGFRFWNQTGGFVQYAGIAGAKGRFLGFFSVLISAAFAFIGPKSPPLLQLKPQTLDGRFPKPFELSGALFALTRRGQAPQIFAKLRKDGLPWVAVVFCSLFSLLSFMAAAKGSAGTAFGYFSSMTALCGMVSWTCILWTSIRWHKGLKVQGIDRKSTLAYTAPLQPYLSYYGLVVCIIVVIFGGFTSFIHEFDTSAFITTYFPIPFFAALFVGCKLIKKSKMIRYEDMDFSTGSSLEMESRPAPTSFWKKISQTI